MTRRGSVKRVSKSRGAKANVLKVGRLVVATVMAATAFVAVSVPSASALTITTVGRPGTGLIYRATAAADGSLNFVMVVGEATAYRSPYYPRNKQYVCHTVNLNKVLFRPNGAPVWQREARTQEVCAGMNVGNRAGLHFQSSIFYPIDMNTGYSPGIKMVWKLGSGKVIGTRYVHFTSKKDFLCESPYPTCSVGYNAPYRFAFVLFM